MLGTVIIGIVIVGLAVAAVAFTFWHEGQGPRFRRRRH
jgi:flagellar basal body-associated protein FliL